MKRKRREFLHPPSHFFVSHGGYPFDVLVTIGMGLREVRDLIVNELHVKLKDDELRTFDDDSTSRRASTFIFDSGPTAIVMSPWNGTPKDHAHLAHEIFHNVAGVFERIGIEYHPSSEEAFAYAIEDLTHSILGELAKPPSKRRREP